ncbi:MAG: hypothetical protein AAGC68_06760 [Verrucomicrobiota bacterium]
MNCSRLVSLLICLSLTESLIAESPELAFADSEPQRYTFSKRASELDPSVQSYPKINFLIEDKNGKPADLQDASVDTSVTPRGRLVIWLMGSNEELFKRLNSYGLHVIRPHYANKWFSVLCQEKPVGPQCRGNIRLEAATGDDHSDELDLAKPDGMMRRSFKMIQWLAEEHPAGKWAYFLNHTGDDLDWEKVIMSGSSHGSTTASRFAKKVKVARVVALCGPRDQYQTWQSLPSATPENRYFGFSHVLDSGWGADHYCRSWELLGMHKFGPIINVDETPFPFGNSRRLITDCEVDGDAKRAHGAVTPGKNSGRDTDGNLLHEHVWRYLYTHPVDLVGDPVLMDDDCLKEQPQ